MSKNGEKASIKAPEEHQKDSVFDFLYCDTRRIGSFLAQFDDAGHLEKVIQRESLTKGVKRGVELSLGGGASLAGTGGSGNVAFKRGPSDEGAEASERIYDPLWTNARTFLDYLHGADLLHRNVSKTRIGQFTLLSGSLAIFDLSTLRSAWEQPYIRNLLKIGMEGGTALPQPLSRQQRRASGKHPTSSDQASPADAVLGMLQFLPHGIVASIRFDAGNVWCNLNS
ncbi:MAG: hypothetical protein ACLPKB_22475 [Xanthobacteraceae bacterium]